MHKNILAMNEEIFKYKNEIHFFLNIKKPVYSREEKNYFA